MTTKQQPPICPNCGQWQQNAKLHTRSNGDEVIYADCVNECTKRGFAPRRWPKYTEEKQP
jgi:hypothetical protein